MSLVNVSLAPRLRARFDGVRVDFFRLPAFGNLLVILLSMMMMIEVDSLPGVGGTKIQDLYCPPSQFLVFFLLSSQREDFLQSLALYRGFFPSLSASKILLYPLRPALRISTLKVSLYPECLRTDWPPLQV